MYCCANDPGQCKSKRNYGELSNKGLEECESFVKDLVSTRSDDANDLGVPLFISEFGACSGSKTCAKELDLVVSAADAHALSWTYYQFKGFGDYSTQYGQKETLGMYNQDGQLDMDKYFQLSRTYAPAVQGQTASSFYDEESGVFVLDFSCDMSINAPTLIYLNEKEHYPNGYKASIEYGLEDHKIRAKVDQTERNYYKVELH